MLLQAHFLFPLGSVLGEVIKLLIFLHFSFLVITKVGGDE